MLNGASGPADSWLGSRWDSAAGTGRGALGSEGFFPAFGRQLPEVFVRMAGQPPQDVVEVGIGFHPQPFASDHEREEIGGLLSPRLLADVQPVAPAQHHSSERMFGRVIERKSTRLNSSH